MNNNFPNVPPVPGQQAPQGPYNGMNQNGYPGYPQGQYSQPQQTPGFQNMQPQQAKGSKFYFISGIISGAVSLVVCILSLIALTSYQSIHELAYFTAPVSFIGGIFALVVLICGIISLTKQANQKVKTGVIIAACSLVLYLITAVVSGITFVKHAEYAEYIYEQFNPYYDDSYYY